MAVYTKTVDLIMFDFKVLMQSMTNRLVLIIVFIYFVIDGVFAGHYSGLELFFLQNPRFAFWQFFSSVFLHGSVLHLAFNMLALWSFGRVLEQLWGKRRFWIFFLVCGIGAGLIAMVVQHYQYQSVVGQLVAGGISLAEVQAWVETGRIANSSIVELNTSLLRQCYALYNVPMVGASGAIYGLLVAFAMLFPNFQLVLIFLPIPIKAKYFVPVLLGIDLGAGVTGYSIFGQNVAHFAHIGGALIGAVLTWFWARRWSTV